MKSRSSASGRSVWGQTENTPPLLNTTHMVHINTQWVEVKQLWRNFTPLLTAIMDKRVTVFSIAATEGVFFTSSQGKQLCFTVGKNQLKTGNECYCELLVKESFTTVLL